MGCSLFLYGFVQILMNPVLIYTFALLWDIVLVITFPYFGDNGIQPHRGRITRKTITLISQNIARLCFKEFIEVLMKVKLLHQEFVCVDLNVI